MRAHAVPVVAVLASAALLACDGKTEVKVVNLTTEDICGVYVSADPGQWGKNHAEGKMLKEGGSVTVPVEGKGTYATKAEPCSGAAFEGKVEVLGPSTWRIQR